MTIQQTNQTLLRFLELGERYPGLTKLSEQFELAFYSNEIRATKIDRPVFVSGLARSGSTFLTQSIWQTSEFASLSNGDLPFPETPLFWRRFSRLFYHLTQPAERIHGDGLELGVDSPDAYEEILWRRAFPDLYTTSASWIRDEHQMSEEFMVQYEAMIKKVIIKEGKARYLAKGNYAFLRKKALQTMFPDLLMVVPIRRPEYQIASLVRVHRRFQRMANHDQHFARFFELMGHHEFGPLRLPIHLGDQKRFDRIREHWHAGRDVEGYALLWQSVYEYVVSQLDEHCVILPIDCEQNTRHLQILSERLGTKQSLRLPLPRRATPTRPVTVDPELTRLYERLSQLAQ